MRSSVRSVELASTTGSAASTTAASDAAWFSGSGSGVLTSGVELGTESEGEGPAVSAGFFAGLELAEPPSVRVADELSADVVDPADVELGVFAPVAFVAEDSVPVDLDEVDFDGVDVEPTGFASAELAPEGAFFAAA